MKMRPNLKHYLQFPSGSSITSIRTWAQINDLNHEIIIEHNEHTALFDVDDMVGNNWACYFYPDTCESRYFFKDKSDAFAVKLLLS